MGRVIIAVYLSMLFAADVQGQNIINGSFESWHSYNSGGQSLESPNGWYGGDSLFDSMPIYSTSTQKQIFNTNYVHSGSGAVKIITKVFGAAQKDTIPGILASGKLQIDSNSGEIITSRLPVVDRRVGSISAWLKYDPLSTDTGGFAARFYKTGLIGSNGLDSVVGTGEAGISALSTYTKVTIPITYVDSFVVPDRVLIMFGSSGYGRTNTAGSSLYVDDVVLNLPTSITTPPISAFGSECFPNPSSGVLFLKAGVSNTVFWNLYSQDGRLLFSKHFVGESRIFLENLPCGAYRYSFSDKTNKVIQTGNLILAY